MVQGLNIQVHILILDIFLSFDFSQYSVLEFDVVEPYCSLQILFSLWI